MFAPSMTTLSRGEPISSMSRRAFRAESTVLAISGSMPRVTPCSSALRTASRITTARSLQALSIVIGVAPPHVLAVPAAGAERDDRSAECRRRGDHPAEAGETGGALGAIGVDHVEGARQRRHGQPTLGEGIPDARTERLVDRGGKVSPTAQTRSNWTLSAPVAAIASRFRSSVVRSNSGASRPRFAMSFPQNVRSSAGALTRPVAGPRLSF